MAQVPLTVPPEVKQKMREALGLGQPIQVQYYKWIIQFFWIEPQVLVDHWFGTAFSEGKQRVISWQTRSPVMDIVIQRLPQTLWVVGLSYIVGILIALPIGIYFCLQTIFSFRPSRYIYHNDWFLNPTFFTGPLLIVLFSVQLGWLPSIYDTTHVVTDWASFKIQFYQMIMPVMVLALQTTAPVKSLYAFFNARQPRSRLCADRPVPKDCVKVWL